MDEPEIYDLLVLGSGEGGKFLAWDQAKAGKRVAVIERKLIGGACPNIACLPSKNEIWSAKVAHLVRNAFEFGVTTGPVSLDMAAVRARKRGMVDGLIAMHLDFYKASGAELVMGHGRFVAPKVVEVALNEGGTRRLTAERIVLNLGSRATVPPIPGLAQSTPLTHVEFLELDRLPSHLIVLGGGYVGLELAHAARRFGAEVTVLEAGPRLLAREDADLATALQGMLKAEGVAIQPGARVTRVEGRSGDGVIVHVETASGTQAIAGSDILVATGRTPNTDGAGLDIAGVALDAHGIITCNDRLETSAAGIWAIGDCAGSPLFTHVSADDFRIVRAGITGGSRSTRGRLVPHCMFTDPPLARVGLSEDEARAQGIAVRVATLPIMAVLRSRTLSETGGFMKALVEAEGDRILGFAMLGAEAGEVMAVVQIAMLGGLPYTVLSDAILCHPTMAEGLGSLFARLSPRAA